MQPRTFLCLKSSRYWRQYGRCCSAFVIIALRHCVAASALLGACAQWATYSTRRWRATLGLLRED